MACQRHPSADSGPGSAIESLRLHLHRKDSWMANDDEFAAAVEKVRAELVDGLLAAPFDGLLEAEAQVAAFSANWTRRAVGALGGVGQPAVGPGDVQLGPAQ